MTAIENTEAAASLIEALPDAESIKISDETAIQAAQQAYDALTSHEKELVGAPLKAKLDATQAALKQAQDAAKAEGTPQTGDESHTALCLMIMVAASFSLISTAIYSRRKKKYSK